MLLRFGEGLRIFVAEVGAHERQTLSRRRRKWDVRNDPSPRVRHCRGGGSPPARFGFWCSAAVFRLSAYYFRRRFCARINSRRTFVSAMRRIIFTPGLTTRQYIRKRRRAPGLVGSTRVSVLMVPPPAGHSSAARFITIFANPGSAKAMNSLGVRPRN